MSPQNILDPAGPAAAALAELGWTIIVVFLVTTVAVWVIIGWIALRRRGTLEEHLPVETTSGQAWILVGGIAVPLVVLAGLWVYSLQTMAAFPIAAAQEPLHLRVVGRQWWFSADYLGDGRPGALVSVPTEIHIPVGRAVDIELVTRDVIHSFWIPRLHGKVDLVPGLPNRIRIRADAPGVYRGECAEFCGVQHAHMRIEVVAQPPAEFERWLAAQREPAAEPRSAEARRGREVFLRSPCVACHTVRGTPALASVGPDLTHVASRARIAGGALANTTGNLSAWVINAQSLKPGARMPDIRQLSGEELHALVAYLQSLE